MKNKYIACLFVTGIFFITDSKRCFAQEGYLSVFGDNGCSRTSNCNAMNTRSIPSGSSFTGIYDLVDPFYSFSNINTIPLTSANYLENSEYDNAGNLLFSVNPDGIYNSNGTIVCQYNQLSTYSSVVYPYTSPCNSSAFTTDLNNIFGGEIILGIPWSPYFSVSESVIFPCSKDKDNSNYWVVCWISINGNGPYYYQQVPSASASIDKNIPMAFKVYGTMSGTTYNIDSVQPHIMVDFSSTTLTNLFYGLGLNHSFGTTDPYYQFLVSADDFNCDGTRNVYTLEEYENDGRICAGPFSYFSLLRKWTFNADGTLDVACTPTQFETCLPPSAGGTAKILSINGSKYFTYIANNVGSYNTSNGVGLHLCNLSGGTDFDYTFPLSSANSCSSSGDGIANITGFEYEPTNNYIYLSVMNFTFPLSTALIDNCSTGLYYWDVSSGFATGSTNYISGTNNIASTDIQIDEHGDLLMVNGSISNYGQLTSNEGSLAYLTPSGSPSSPSIINSSCLTTYPNISNINESVHCDIQSASGFDGPFFPFVYYLGNQIHNENRNLWNSVIEFPYTVSSNEI